tara:strand:- start:205 stop:1287 length:1083 start_codon:yes stop_codon:yes gene_type:complete
MTSEEYQLNIFGGLLIDLVPDLENFESRIDGFFSNQPQVGQHYKNDTSKDLLNLENELSSRLKRNGLSQLNFLNRIIESNKSITPSPFLSEAVIEHILKEHPPVILESFCKSGQNKFTNRTKLALSRFTEDRNWQHSYHKVLNTLQFKDFEHRKPVCIEISIETLATLATDSGHILKPWGLSHSKETGVIIYFDGHETSLPTPNLLTLAVFLHYLHEVEHYSKFLETNQNLQAGQLTKNIIRSKEPILPFLTDGNAHDETLYWEEAIKDLGDIIVIPKNLLTNNLSFSNQTATSMNFIDLIWNINNIGSCSNHIYHLQQEKWFELLSDLANLSKEEFNRKAKNSLMLDNLSFMQKLLKYT